MKTKKLLILNFSLFLMLLSCMNKLDYFKKIGLKEDGNIVAECIYLKKTISPYTKLEEKRYVKDKCILNLENIKNLADYCVLKDISVKAEYNDLIEQSKSSLNADKIIKNYKPKYDNEYKALRDKTLDSDVETISFIDLSKIDEDVAKYYLTEYDNFKARSRDYYGVYNYSLKDIPDLLIKCDISLIQKKSPYHKIDAFEDLWH